MVKRGIAFLILAITVLMIGCDTTKGAAVGVGAAAVSVAEGMKKDWDNAKRADDWMQKNLW